MTCDGNDTLQSSRGSREAGAHSSAAQELARHDDSDGGIRVDETQPSFRLLRKSQQPFERPRDPWHPQQRATKNIAPTAVQLKLDNAPCRRTVVSICGFERWLCADNIEHSFGTPTIHTPLVWLSISFARGPVSVNQPCNLGPCVGRANDRFLHTTTLPWSDSPPRSHQVGIHACRMKHVSPSFPSMRFVARFGLFRFDRGLRICG